MLPLTGEWVEKAEGDFATALRELRARKMPNYDSACFHAQQCAEKYLKACLQEAGVPFGRTHNLVALVALLLPVDPSWDALRPQLTALTGYAVTVRYPGATADRADARQAVSLSREVREHARQQLGLSP